MSTRTELPTLPINQILPALRQQLLAHDSLVLEAPPGAGKTTMVPLALLKEPWLAGKKILMLEPRRMAARAAAQRMATLLGEKPGQTIGYRVRQESRVSNDTRVEVITEGILTRMLLDDPSLEHTGLLIFDEFHERSLDADLGLALVLQGRTLFRDEQEPLRLMLMSATLDGDRISQLLDNAPVLRSEGKMFPVRVRYQKASRFDDDIVYRSSNTLIDVLARHSENVLVFLPGQREIHRVIEQTQKQLSAEEKKRTELLPLYGALSIAEQQRAIDSHPQAKRKVVLATDIAETSLTIDGIGVVIDSGLCREPRFDPATAMTRLQTRRISRDSSIQRLGRAGRLQAGDCYRLWSEEQQQQLAQHRTPEIAQADLIALVLQLLAWGVDSIDELQLLDKPPTGAIQQALELLSLVGAISARQNPTTELGHWQLSSHGENMSRLPVHPRLAHMLLVGKSLDRTEIACALAALLSDRSPLARELGADIATHLAVVLGQQHCHNQHKTWLQKIRQQAKQFQKLLLNTNTSTASDNKHPPLSDLDALAVLLAAAYPDRIARKKSDNYLLSNGRSALLKDSQLNKAEYLVIAELSGSMKQGSKSRHDFIHLACTLAPGLFASQLQSLLQENNVVKWDKDGGRLIAERQTHIGKLLIESSALNDISVEERKAALLAYIKERGIEILPWTPALRQWQARVVLLRTQLSAENTKAPPWPDVSNEALQASLDDWLEPYLDNIRKLSALKQLDLSNILHGLLPWPLPQQLQELAPETITVPSGSQLRVDYLLSPPVLKVKLQEMFGCTTTPSVALGRIPLMVHLLSPAQRPLQITQDLAGFWQNSYHEIKKDMKGRYPKHPWPDDPLQAVASRHTKKRQQKD